MNAISIKVKNMRLPRRDSFTPLIGLIAAIATLAASLVIAGPATPTLAANGKKSELHTIAVGDSVMLGAKYELLRRGVEVVNAKVSRQASSGPALIKKLASNPSIKNVVVHLGTNGSYTTQNCKDIVKAAGADRVVYLVNLKVPRSWEKKNNKTMAACAATFSPSRVRLLNWNSVSQSNSSYLYSDGMHLTPQGAKKFAKMIVQAVKQTVTSPAAFIPTAVQR